MDEFLIRDQLHKLDVSVKANKDRAEFVFKDHAEALDSLDGRMLNTEEKDVSLLRALETLQAEMVTMKTSMSNINAELIKTKLVNVKQDMVIRTMNNLTAFDGYDMFVDTFADGKFIDFNKSVRAELMVDKQAVGKTRSSIVEVKQTSNPLKMLIAGTDQADKAVAQSFMISKDKQVDKLSILASPYNDQTYMPMIVSIRKQIDGPDLTSRDVQVSEAIGVFIDIDVPDIVLKGGEVYYLVIQTNDPYGYKIGYDSADKYLSGTSFNKFGNVWSDNGYDIGFKIWCFPSADENNAIIYTLPKMFPAPPASIVFEAEHDVSDGGSVNYAVSRDGGTNWKILQPGIETNLNDLPTGRTLLLRASIEGSGNIMSWGYVITGGDGK